ncbi:hypothetical protein POM88_001904 [Heracleum sosnowskyi]|uniref:Uncharacterized protein n=1 Tax=Heracleum sosnowskyi TaxID=360622 RepID=A0AAD8JF62_9APIA|nr:hypothetical protein POM88_001904 [Heracleum sosnowskyi]
MGNCFYRQKKPIKVMKADGEILEYQAPMKVHKLLEVYSGHAVFKIMPAKEPLRPHVDMLSGQLYYLQPHQIPSLVFDEKNHQYSNSKVVLSEKSSGVLRIKLVISKHELELMLRKGGVSLSDINSQIQQIQRAKKVDNLDREGSENCEPWKPVLQSIPEVN